MDEIEVSSYQRRIILWQLLFPWYLGSPTPKFPLPKQFAPSPSWLRSLKRVEISKREKGRKFVDKSLFDQQQRMASA